MRSQPRNAKPVIQAVLGVVALALALVVGGMISARVGPAPPPQWRAPTTMLTTPPVPIARLVPGPAQQIVRGYVGEIHGADFVLVDSGGHVLVRSGRHGAALPGVTLGAVVTVQGRFEDGVLHAAFLRDAAGAISALGAAPAGGTPFAH